MSLKEKMRELKLSFVEKLPEYLGKIEPAYKKLSENKVSDANEAIQELFLQFHSVKGAAATFGFNELKEISKEGEKNAAHLKEIFAKDGLSKEFWQVLADLGKDVSDLKVEIKNTSKDGEIVLQVPSFDISTIETPNDFNDLEEKLVFICDDDPDSVEHLRLQLKYLGYYVKSFADTDSLLEAAMTSKPSALVMDITFPRGQLSGTEVVKLLRTKVEKLPPVVFISSRSDYQARFEAVQAGGDSYFVKPLKTFDLVHTLDELTKHESDEVNRILIVDDEPEIAQYHSAVLQQAKMETMELYSPDNILEVLESFKPDLVLMDMYMPKYSGRDVAKVIRQIPEYLSLPIIYLSSEMDQSKQANALRAGAEGFLTKPINPMTLINEVNVRAKRLRDLRAHMVKDSLTGLFNHTFIQRSLEVAFANANRSKQTCCVVIIDIDFFKNVNDTYGHQMGDQVLSAISRLLSQSVREGDAVGRYGGEEFVIVLNNISIEKARRIIESIREGFSSLKFEHNDTFFYCTFSAGISDSNSYNDATEMMEAADQALYLSKRSGRNMVSLSREVRDE